MKVIIPIDIGEDLIVSTNLSEDEYPEWAASNNYAIKDFVLSKHTHQIYRALKASLPNPDRLLDWDAGRDYMVGDRVFVASTRIIYATKAENGPGSSVQNLWTIPTRMFGRLRSQRLM